MNGPACSWYSPILSFARFSTIFAHLLSACRAATLGLVAFAAGDAAAKVIIQPEGFETAYLPIASSWVGNLWGMFCPPTPGDEVDLHFQEDGKNDAYVSLRFFGGAARPLSVVSGEFSLVHKSGSLIKLTNDGKVTFADAAGSVLVLNNDGTTILTSNLIVNGNISATGDITDRDATGGSTMAHFRSVYDIHTHGNAQGGSDNTAVPNQTL